MIAPRRLATALALAAVSVALVFARTPGDGARPVPTVAFSADRRRRVVRAPGGTETIAVMIPRDAPDNWFQMDACLRAPGLPQQEAQISAMLRTVRMAKGD
jgi:hypothetical protein